MKIKKDKLYTPKNIAKMKPFSHLGATYAYQKILHLIRTKRLKAVNIGFADYPTRFAVRGSDLIEYIESTKG